MPGSKLGADGRGPRENMGGKRADRRRNRTTPARRIKLPFGAGRGRGSGGGLQSCLGACPVTGADVNRRLRSPCEVAEPWKMTSSTWCWMRTRQPIKLDLHIPQAIFMSPFHLSRAMRERTGRVESQFSASRMGSSEICKR